MATPPPVPPPPPYQRPKSKVGVRLAQTLLPAVIGIALLVWWGIYGQRTKWELHREGGMVYLAGESENTITMLGSTRSVRVQLSVGCENGKDFIHLNPIPVLPIGPTDGQALNVSFGEVFYLTRSHPGSHYLRMTSWRTIPPYTTLLERVGEPASDPAIDMPGPDSMASNAPRFANRMGDVELYEISSGAIDLRYGTKGFREQLPELMTACGWQSSPAPSTPKP